MQVPLLQRCQKTRMANCMDEDDSVEIGEEYAMDNIVGCLLVLVEYNLVFQSSQKPASCLRNTAHFAYDAGLLRALIFASEDDKTSLRNSSRQDNVECRMLLIVCAMHIVM